MQFFYDAQIRRYITQLIRMVSNFSVQDAHGNEKQVPVMYGDLTRQVANIIRDNSENKIPTAPRMAVYVTGLEMDRDRTADSSLISKRHIRERTYDSATGQYLNTQGKNYTVERHMPAPYTLKVSVDIWASNTEQKLQILEQILVLFNPSFEIQTTDNYLDWTSLTVVNMEGITFSSRSIPVGVDSEIDVANLQFSTPIYLTPPAKVKRLGVTTSIISNIFNEQQGDINLGATVAGQIDGTEPTFITRVNTGPIDSIDDGSTNTVDDGVFPNQGTGLMDFDTKRLFDKTSVSSTYQNYGLHVENDVAQLVYKNKIGDVSWNELVEAYPGTYQAGVSRILLKSNDNDTYVTGTFTINPLDETKIVINFDSDTLPDDTVIAGPARSANSLTTIDYIIDPLRFNPDQIKDPGVRLLILGDIGNSENADGPDAWKNTDGSDFIANESDILEWDGTNWHVIFDASGADDGSTGSPATYISNLNTGIQYKWNGEFWIKSYEGEYSGATWTILLDA
tara:strand:- start:8722 stop:10248 length:1527 start_codon:yes stop_codon:yes gene_type:complete